MVQRNLLNDQPAGCALHYRQWRRQREASPVCKPLCPTGKPSSMQHQFFAFHSTVLRTNRGRLFGAHDMRRQDLESKFSKNFFGLHPRTPLQKGLPHPTRPKAICGAQAPWCWDTDHRALLEVMVPHLYSSTNKLLAPPLISARQHYAERIVCYRQSVWYMHGSVKNGRD